MLLFIDNCNKIIYIMAPKCGTNSIADLLHVNIHKEYTNSELDNLNNPEYKKIIIIRKFIIDRFLSGFYEDLFNNTCYNNMDITFNDYLLFLYKCYKDKIPNVNNMNVYNGLDIPIWFGNCSKVSRSITNHNGDFCSHIQSQKYSIFNIINEIKCKNIQLIELNNLSLIIPQIKKKNVKKKMLKIPNNFDISNLSLAHIKRNIIIIPSNYLTTFQKQIILDMYEEDIKFFRELEEKFKYLEHHIS